MTFDEHICPEPNSGCWLWTGMYHSYGYGLYRGEDGKQRYAHRLSYERCFGPIPSGLTVCHKCDVPSCVNPDHLWLGSQADNIRDATIKHRMAQGEKHYCAKLTAAQVIEIKRMLFEGVRSIDIASRFSISQQSICDIKKGRRWK